MRFTGVFISTLLLLVVTGCAGNSSEVGKDDAGPDGEQANSAEDLTCDDITDQALEISAQDDSGVQLLKVRGAKIVKDQRATYEIPTGNGEETVLVCQGRGVWDDGGHYDVRVELTVDSDRDAWVYYEPVS